MKRVRNLVLVSALLTLGILAWSAFSYSAEPPTEDVSVIPTDPPAVGDTAPEFTLVSNEGTEVSLTEYRDQWVVLYFYPKDFTSGCTIQAKNFERDMEQYVAINAVVLGVSVDSAESHKEFCTKEGLSFKLLSDGDASVSDSYGSVRGEDDNRMSTRNTFIIDPTGIVAKVFLKVNPNPHSGEVLAVLAELQQS